MSKLDEIEIEGFRSEPLIAPDGGIYTGRLTLFDVQLTRNSGGVLATFPISAKQLLDAADNRILWTDQRVQRGIKPEISPTPPFELPLSDGYPDVSKYIFYTEKADEITEKLLRSDKLFLNPLTWNLRPGTFDAYYDHERRMIYIYDGRIYLPDSHHRHQAIVKASRIFQEAPSESPTFSLEVQFVVDLYFVNREDEGDLFYDKNLLPKPTDKAKGYDLTTQDVLAVLAKRVIDRSPSLVGNVNRVTDRLTAKNPQVVTLSTLRGMIQAALTEGPPAEDEIDLLASRIAEFYEVLATVRPELGLLSQSDRRSVRTESLVDAAVMFHGYSGLLGYYLRDAAASDDASATTATWTAKLSPLDAAEDFEYKGWEGDFFSRQNPLWMEVGVLQKTKSGGVAVSNTRQTRDQCRKLVLELVGLGDG